MNWDVETVTKPSCKSAKNELVQIGAGVFFAHPGSKASRLGPRLDLVMALHRPIDHLAAYRLALRAIAVEEAVIGATRKDERKFPGQIVRVLDRGIRTEAIGR